MMVDYMEVLKALSCCTSEVGNSCEEGCDDCPYLETVCDEPSVEYVALPVPLVENVQAILREGAELWQRGGEKS